MIVARQAALWVGVGIAAGGVLRYDTIRQGRIAIHIAIYWAFSAQSYLDCVKVNVMFRLVQANFIYDVQRGLEYSARRWDHEHQL